MAPRKSTPSVKLSRTSRVLSSQRRSKTLLHSSSSCVRGCSVAREAQRLARSYQLQIVVLSCHCDFVASGLLEPTWIFQCDTNLFRRFRDMTRSENQSQVVSFDKAVEGMEFSEVTLLRALMRFLTERSNYRLPSEGNKFAKLRGATKVAPEGNMVAKRWGATKVAPEGNRIAVRGREN